ncbi:MAG: PLDc N-terminal domain-containing protein [Bacteroidales bacterium]
MIEKLICVLIFFSLILWIWAFFDIAKMQFKKPVLKIIWIVAIFLFPILGPILYFQLKNNYG